MGVRLPAEYQEVEYLGKALTSSITTDVYIDTGILTSSEIDYDFAGQALGDNETVTFFGGRDAFKSKSNEIVYVFYNQKSLTGAQFRYGNKAGDSGILAETPAVNIHEVKHYKKDGTTFTCNNSSATTTKQTFSFNKTITLFDVNQRTGLVGNLGGARIYYFKLYEDGELVRSFIPCYRKSDSKPGMYDLVTKQFFTNAGTGEFVVGPDVIDSISPLMVAWRRIMMAAASVAKKLVKLIATSTTGLVSFDTNVEMPTKVICEFSPVQEGTGDPSPDNVRPISGWTGCEIRHFYQLFDENSGTIERKYYSNNGRIMDDDGVITTRIYTQYIPVSPNTMYTIHGDSNDLAYIRVVEFNSIQTFATRTLSSHIQNPSITIRTTSQTRYLRINPDTSVSNIFVYETNAATTTSLPITFTDPSTGDPLIVYGGTVTLNEDGSADVAGTRLSIEFDGSADEDWRFEKTANGYKNAYIAMPSTFKTSQISSTEMICSASPTNATKIGTTYRAVKDACYISNGRNFNFCWLDTLEISSANDFKAWLQDGHSLQVVATLINPITYHFDNIGQLQSFLGTNNIWHSMNGDITVEYWKKQ